MSDVFKVIVSGGRDFSNYQYLKESLDSILKDIKEPIVIVSGGASGTDMLGEKYARSKGYEVERHPAQWELFGRGAGHRRNADMGISIKNNGKGMLVAFWDMESKGTSNMIDVAERYNIPYRVIEY